MRDHPSLSNNNSKTFSGAQKRKMKLNILFFGTGLEKAWFGRIWTKSRNRISGSPGRSRGSKRPEKRLESNICPTQAKFKTQNRLGVSTCYEKAHRPSFRSDPSQRHEAVDRPTIAFERPSPLQRPSGGRSGSVHAMAAAALPQFMAQTLPIADGAADLSVGVKSPSAVPASAAVVRPPSPATARRNPPRCRERAIRACYASHSGLCPHFPAKRWLFDEHARDI